MKKTTYFIDTFGCRLNQAESRVIGEKLAERGFEDVGIYGVGKADIVLINTCVVTSKAEKEVRQAIRRVKRENPECFLVVTGCWVSKIQNSKLEILNSLDIDLLVENENKGKIGLILSKKFGSFRKKRVYKDKYAKYRKALVKVQEGCDNFCSYCIVPFVRGRSKSRSADAIIREIREKVKEEIEEVVLTGVNLGLYKFKAKSEKRKVKIQNLKLDKFENSLVDLLRLILTTTYVKRISFGSIPLEIFDSDFFDLYKESNFTKKLTTHFHIPLQSGCDETLERMERGYEAGEYLRLIKKLEREIEGFSLSTDLIVGFPGETEEEFERSFGFVRKIRAILGKKFRKIHIFRYSVRYGTRASYMESKKIWKSVDEKEKKRRTEKARELF